MDKNIKNIKFPSELRLDLASKDWVVIATGRGKRPEMFKSDGRKVKEISKAKCPFCHISAKEKPVLILANGKNMPIGEKLPKNWTTIIIPNKFPAFLPDKKLEKRIEGGLYQTVNAVGFHEVVVTRDHKKAMSLLSKNQIKEVIDAYQARFMELAKKDFVNYVFIFHNHGSEAGASISHSHSQIITTPLIDSGLRKALIRAEKYFNDYHSCLYCKMNAWEKQVKQRIIFENKDFIVVCPFASKAAFEIIISPKNHLSRFEKITEKEKYFLAEAFQTALSKLRKGLNDPAFNFYLHTAPCDGKDYKYYHWHWTILPKTSIWAGFELGARMEISTIEPEKAAEYLRKQ